MPAAVPVIALTRNQDHVEAINKCLRNAGHPVHVTWLPDASDLGDALTQSATELLLLFADESIVDLPGAMDFRARFAPEVPVLLVREQVDEAVIAAALAVGAQDAVTLSNLPRFVAVVSRELRAQRLDRALSATLATARSFQKQLQAFVEGSVDAYAHVQEGIIVDANPAWLDLFGFDSADSVVRTPLMDLFDSDDHAAIKGALVACRQGKWSGEHNLRASALTVGGNAPALEFELEAAEFDGEPCVRLCVPRRDDREVERRLNEAMQCDPATGFMHRRYFIEALRLRLAESGRGGVRYLAYIEPDRYAEVLEELGIIVGEEFLTEFARVLRAQLQPGDLAGRATGAGFMILIERGQSRDAEAWAEHVAREVANHLFQIGDKSITTTCTVGLGMVPAALTNPEGPAADAYRASRIGHKAGGNRVQMLDHTDAMLRLQDQDEFWVKQVRLALMDGRFHLVQQPIASLVGKEQGLFDVLVRMVDEAGSEVLPGLFMPAAERNGLMKNIDRWVIGAAMEVCASRRPGGLFLRLSQDSLADPTLAIWLGNQLKASKIEARRIVFQIREETASLLLKEAVALRETLHQLGFRIALEGFGLGRDPEQLLTHLMPDYAKIHGALMQGLAADPEKHERVRALVTLARKNYAVTIGERVEDANTMAVLWQLGVEFIQGYYINAPEEITLG